MTDISSPDTTAIILDCRIEAGNWPDVGELKAKTQETLNAVEQNHAFCQHCQVLAGSELSILFTDDAHIARLNTDFRNKPKPTNVLSFPQQPAGLSIYGPFLGDIVVAQETVFREAKLEKKDIMHHLQHLMVHGFLHLVGFDHETDNDAEKMEALEISILNDLKIKNPYINTVN